MRMASWPRVVSSGVVWAVIYNLVWGLAWFTFMRGAWFSATAAISQALPWTVIWTVWLVLSLPLGLVSMAYVRTRSAVDPVANAALAAAFVLWLPLTVGMAVWGWQASLPAPIIAEDSAVNLVALVAASLAGGWAQRVVLNRQRTA